MQPLRLVFAGTPEFAVPCLDAVLAGPDRLLAVYTQPDRPAGRGRQLHTSAVKQRAEAAALEVRQPVTLRDPEQHEALRALQPDLLIVVAYGLLLPKKVLEIPRYGCWNVHGSLLPRWRGAAPIQRAVEAGAQVGHALRILEEAEDAHLGAVLGPGDDFFRTHAPELPERPGLELAGDGEERGVHVLLQVGVAGELGEDSVGLICRLAPTAVVADSVFGSTGSDFGHPKSDVQLLVTTRPAPWPQFRAGPAHPGSVPATSLITAATSLYAILLPVNGARTF